MRCMWLKFCNYFYHQQCIVYILILDEEKNYEDSLAEISTMPGKKRLRKLMKSTFRLRRMWILEESPEVAAILTKFPCLKEERYVSLHCVGHASFVHKLLSFCMLYLATEGVGGNNGLFKGGS